MRELGEPGFGLTRISERAALVAEQLRCRSALQDVFELAP